MHSVNIIAVLTVTYPLGEYFIYKEKTGHISAIDNGTQRPRAITPVLEKGGRREMATLDLFL